MSDDTDTALELAKLKGDMKALEERMNTLQANLTASLEGFRTDQARLREDMAKRDTSVDASLTRLREDMAKREAEAARRDKDNQRWTVGFGVAQIVLTLAALGAGFAFLGILLST